MQPTALDPNTTTAAQLLSLPLAISENQRKALEAMKERGVIWQRVRLAHIAPVGVVESEDAALEVLAHYGIGASENACPYERRNEACPSPDFHKNAA